MYVRVCVCARCATKHINTYVCVCMSKYTCVTWAANVHANMHTRWCPPSYVCWFITPMKSSSVYLP